MSCEETENIQANGEESALFHTHTVYTRETLMEMQKSAIKPVAILMAVLFVFMVSMQHMKNPYKHKRTARAALLCLSHLVTRGQGLFLNLSKHFFLLA